VGTYGNSLGLPNIGGETEFDSSYQENPLVNALCVGVLRHEDIHLANATGAGNKVVLFGARTGGDGIGGGAPPAEASSEVAQEMPAAPRSWMPSTSPAPNRSRQHSMRTFSMSEELWPVRDRGAVGAAVIGEVNGSGRLTIDHFGERIVDVDPRTVAHEGPTYEGCGRWSGGPSR